MPTGYFSIRKLFPEPFRQPWQKSRRRSDGTATKGSIAQRKAKRERRKGSR